MRQPVPERWLYQPPSPRARSHSYRHAPLPDARSRYRGRGPRPQAPQAYSELLTELKTCVIGATGKPHISDFRDLFFGCRGNGIRMEAKFLLQFYKQIGRAHV